MLPTDVYVKAAAKGALYHKSNLKLFILCVIMTIIAIVDVGIRNNFWDFKNGQWGFLNCQAVAEYCNRQAKAH